MRFLSSYLCLLMLSFISLCSTAQTGSYTALDFNGSQYVIVSDNSELNPTAKITVEAWINADSYGSTSYTNSIFCKHGWATGNAGYVLRCGDNGKASFNIGNASGTWIEAVTTTSVMSTGKWYHIAGSYDGDTVAVYVNGKMVAYNLYNGSITPSSGLNPRIGDLANGGGRLFDGKIDEVRVWKTAIDESTLRDWMCRKVSSSHPNYSSLGGYFKLDEGSGTSTKDETGNATKNGLANSPSWVISGAPLGDVSSHTYNASDLSLRTKFGDEFMVQKVTASSAPSTVHVYANYQGSEQENASTANGKDDSTHYFGVYVMGSATTNFKIKYNYGNLTKLGTRECGIDMYEKTTGYQGTWTGTPTKLFPDGDSLVVDGRTAKEFLPVFYETDSNKIITTSNGKTWFCGTDPVVLTASGNDSFSYKWYLDSKLIISASGQQLSVDSVGKYKVILTRKGTSCSYSSATIHITSKAAPTVSFTKLSGVCEDIDSIALTGGSPAKGIYSGSGVFSQQFFSPSKVRSGNYVITYSYTDSNACIGRAKQTMTVFALPEFKQIKSLEVCDDRETVLLNHHSPSGGTHVGKYVFNNYFRLDSSNYKTGYHTFVYSFTNADGCTNQITDSILIKGASPCTFPSVKDVCLQDGPLRLGAFPSPGTYIGKGINNDEFDPNKAGIGKHLLKYSFTNANNCTTTDSQFVTVKANGSISWNFSLNTCQNADSVQLSPGTPTDGTFAGSGITSNNYFHPKKLAAGNHELIYQAKDTGGCINKAKVVVILKDTTALSFTSITPFCVLSDTVSLKNANVKGGIYDGIGIKNNVFSAGLAGSGKHTIFYTLTNAKSCTSIGKFEIVVLKNDSIYLNLPKKLCTDNDPVFIQLYPSGGTLTGKGTLSNLFAPASAGVGNHLITYSFIGSNGCKVSDSMSVLVEDKPTVSLAKFASICDNDAEFALTGGLPKIGGIYFVNETQMVNFEPKNMGAGIFSIKYRVINSAGCSDSTTTTLRVNKSPAKPLISIQKNTLTSSAGKGNQWFDKNGKIDGETDVQLNPDEDGSYFVVVTSDSGCSAKSDDFTFVKLGVHSIDYAQIRIFPNPSQTGLFHMSGLGMEPWKATVYNMLGEGITSIEYSSYVQQLDLQKLKNGFYYVRIEQNGRLFTALVQIQK